MSASRWFHIWEQADERGMVSPADLARMSESFYADDRLLALFTMRRQIDYYGPSSQYLDVARTCVDDPDADCRWQAMMVLAELLTWYPELAWSVIKTHGESNDDEKRLLATNFLLKHLLRKHGATYQAEVDAWTKRSPRFARNYAMRLMSVAR